MTCHWILLFAKCYRFNFSFTLYVTTIIRVNCVDFHVVTHMFLIIIRHYKGTHATPGGSLTIFVYYYPLCCISSAPCYNCVFQHLSRYMDVQQESPCPLAMLVLCWVDLCVVISASGFTSFRLVHGRINWTTVITGFLSTRGLPTLLPTTWSFGSTQNISCRSAVELVLLICFRSYFSD